MNRDKLHVRLRASDEYSFLKLRGVIDEDNELTALIPRLKGSVLVIDTADVERINSCGVRDWVNWLSQLQASSHRVVLIRCSPSIIGQVNLVANFVGEAVVHSFFAPYYCPSCDREVRKLIEASAIAGDEERRAPAFRCGECGGELEFDDLEASYFAFLAGVDPSALGEQLQTLVEAVAPDVESKIRALNDAGSGSNPLSGPVHTVNPTPEGSTPSSVTPLPTRVIGLKGVAEASARERELEHEAGLPDDSSAYAPIGSTRRTNTLMALLVASMLLVAGLVVYLAVTGV